MIARLKGARAAAVEGASPQPDVSGSAEQGLLGAPQGTSMPLILANRQGVLGLN